MCRYPCCALGLVGYGTMSQGGPNNDLLAPVVEYRTRLVVGYETRSGPGSEESCHVRVYVLVPHALHNADCNVRDK